MYQLRMNTDLNYEVRIDYEQSYLNQGLKTLEAWYDAETNLEALVSAKNKALGLSDDDLTADELIDLWADWLK